MKKKPNEPEKFNKPLKITPTEVRKVIRVRKLAFRMPKTGK